MKVKVLKKENNIKKEEHKILTSQYLKQLNKDIAYIKQQPDTITVGGYQKVKTVRCK